MDMIKSRNQTSHTYNQETKDDIVNETITNYESAFENLLVKFQGLKSNE